MKPVWIKLLLLVCATFVVACTTTEVKTSQVVKARSVLLLPVESLQIGLVAAGDPLYQALVKGLDKKRFDVITTDKDRYQSALDDALAASGAMYDPSLGKFLPLDRRLYIKGLIDFYAKDEDFTVIILPELLIRVASVSGDYASWDGVERRIELAEEPERPYRQVRNVRGVSLKLSVFTRQGADIVQSYAGLSLPYTVNYNQKPPVLVLKEPFYTSKEQNEAVNLALKTVFNQVKYHAKY